MDYLVRFLRNLVGGDMPLRRRVRIFATNSSRRLLRRSLCCGHPGEPGC